MLDNGRSGGLASPQEAHRQKINNLFITFEKHINLVNLDSYLRMTLNFFGHRRKNLVGNKII